MSDPVALEDKKQKRKERWEVIQGFLWLFGPAFVTILLAVGKLAGAWAGLSWWWVFGPVLLLGGFLGSFILALLCLSVMVTLGGS